MPTLGFLSSIGPLEIGIILFVGLLLFGRRLPEVGRGLGKSITEFKRGLKEVTDDVDQAATEVRKIDAGEPSAPASGHSGTVATPSGETVQRGAAEGPSTSS